MVADLLNKNILHTCLLRSCRFLPFRPMACSRYVAAAQFLANVLQNMPNNVSPVTTNFFFIIEHRDFTECITHVYGYRHTIMRQKHAKTCIKINFASNSSFLLNLYTNIAEGNFLRLFCIVKFWQCSSVAQAVPTTGGLTSYAGTTTTRHQLTCGEDPPHVVIREW